jgi:pre-mRNA-splicing factor ATP-dependent RNA helicase DHX15/PRP43
LKKLGVEDLIRFDYLSPPTPQSIARALELGYYLGAIDDHGNLTELGSLIVEFPLVPPLAKMLIASAQKYGCSNEILTLVSLLSTQNCLIRPVGQKKNADQRHKQFVHNDGLFYCFSNQLMTFR